MFFFGGENVAGDTLNGAAVNRLELDILDFEFLPDVPRMLLSDGIPTQIPMNDGDQGAGAPGDSSFFIIGNAAGEFAFVNFVFDAAISAIFGTPDNDALVGTTGGVPKIALIAAVNRLELDILDFEFLPDVPRMLLSDGIPTQIPMNDGDQGAGAPGDSSFFIIGNAAGEFAFVNFVFDTAISAVFGTPDTDALVGTGGDDLIFGFDGDDTLNGGLGDDTLDGGAGADILFGNAGADTLTGGAGADIFALGQGDGGVEIEFADIITDFEDGVDLIGLTGGLDVRDIISKSRQQFVGKLLGQWPNLGFRSIGGRRNSNIQRYRVGQ